MKHALPLRCAMPLPTGGSMIFLDHQYLTSKALAVTLESRKPLEILLPSIANIAKQRLKMILFSDRCAVSDEAKQKIVSNVVSALSDFVEIESQDKVQLSVSTDPSLDTVYSVTMLVRRVKSEF